MQYRHEVLRIFFQLFLLKRNYPFPLCLHIW